MVPEVERRKQSTMYREYRLPFDTSIRVLSRRRYILVRETNHDLDSFIVCRSDDFGLIKQEFKRLTDYIVDQKTGYITYFFNGRTHVFDSRNNGPAPFKGRWDDWENVS
jgi:hypothetical protein